MVERDEEKIRKQEEREEQMKKLALFFDSSSNIEAKAAAWLAMLIGQNLAEEISSFQQSQIDSFRDETEIALMVKEIFQRLNKIEGTPQIENQKIENLVERVTKQEHKFSRYEKTLETLEAWSEGKFRHWFREHFG